MNLQPFPNPTIERAYDRWRIWLLLPATCADLPTGAAKRLAEMERMKLAYKREKSGRFVVWDRTPESLAVADGTGASGKTRRRKPAISQRLAALAAGSEAGAQPTRKRRSKQKQLHL